MSHHDRPGDQNKLKYQGRAAQRAKAREHGGLQRRPNPLPVHSFNHLSKETENVEAMIEFYTEVMGFRRIKRPPFEFPGAWLYMPPSTSLHIIEKDPSVDLPEGPCAAIKKMGNWGEVTKNPASIQRVGHHMAFRTEDMDLTLTLLREHGVPFAERFVPLTGQRQVFFFDPDGNGIELCDCDVSPPPFDDEGDSGQDSEANAQCEERARNKLSET